MFACVTTKNSAIEKNTYLKEIESKVSGGFNQLISFCVSPLEK